MFCYSVDNVGSKEVKSQLQQVIADFFLEKTVIPIEKHLFLEIYWNKIG